MSRALRVVGGGVSQEIAVGIDVPIHIAEIRIILDTQAKIQGDWILARTVGVLEIREDRVRVSVAGIGALRPGQVSIECRAGGVEMEGVGTLPAMVFASVADTVTVSG
ncbi:hypothetical protein GCM10011491_39780 [Brucella endophytica]|uniref:Uncharacterized protein n=1 Tax=Brucella endophytica TaxID=1963359 RepID=A0A916SPW0_9HYPH|nr:hypothetical protein [Brucella endophytica]GGB07786.1 hypothetical protein GCM10011491_39780 [Brucella endophytica]